MKHEVKLLTLIFLPIILFEVLLNFNSNYKTILLNNNTISNINSATVKKGIYPDILIFGSSISRRAFDNTIIQQQLKDDGINVKVENIAVNSSTTLNDYATLLRIIKTCKKCPKKIIYGPTDMALKEPELGDWEKHTLDRLKLLYFENKDYHRMLSEAEKNSKNYKNLVSDINNASIIKTYLVGPHIRNLISYELFKLIKKSDNPSRDKLIDSQKNLVPDIGYGHPLVKNIITDKIKENELKAFENVFSNYKIGGNGKYFFEEFLKYSIKNNIEVIIVITPLHADYYKKFEKQILTFKEYVNKRGYNFKLAVIDGSEFYNKYDRFFEDLYHLNSYGSQKFSVYVAKMLLKNKIY